MLEAQFQPKLRNEAKLDLNGALSYAIWKMLNRTDIFPFRNCLSCKHFKEAEEQCTYWNARPPARVIAFGCNKYDDLMDIPF